MKNRCGDAILVVVVVDLDVKQLFLSFVAYRRKRIKVLGGFF